MGLSENDGIYMDLPPIAILLENMILFTLFFSSHEFFWISLYSFIQNTWGWGWGSGCFIWKGLTNAFVVGMSLRIFGGLPIIQSCKFDRDKLTTRSYPRETGWFIRVTNIDMLWSLRFLILTYSNIKIIYISERYEDPFTRQGIPFHGFWPMHTSLHIYSIYSPVSRPKWYRKWYPSPRFRFGIPLISQWVLSFVDIPQYPMASHEIQYDIPDMVVS